MSTYDEKPLPQVIKSFDKDFVFGAATAAYQIEGGHCDGRGASIWDSFSATGTNVKNKDNGRQACDHYNRWPQDLDLLKSGNFDAYRFSFAWPRLCPDGVGAENAAGFDFYDRLIDGMLERGLRPFATMYHWDLPSALQDKGGWMNRDIASWFADYSAAVTKRFGDRLETIATLNEPWCIAYLSHKLGIHAPGYRDMRAAARAMHHTMLAHGTAVKAMRAETSAPLGIVLNFEHCDPADASPEAVQAALINDGIYNRWFVGSIMQGYYPSDVVEAFGEHMPEGFEKDMPAIAEKIDWLGVNYYTRALHQPAAGMSVLDATDTQTLPGPLDKTAMGWEIFPEGLERLLVRLKNEYTGELPLFVTENGMAWDDKISYGEIHDTERQAYFSAHLQACQAAMAQGVPLKGYFAWSLLDNYEWAEGYEKRFGIVHVDYRTQFRRAKDSFLDFQKGLLDRAKA